MLKLITNVNLGQDATIATMPNSKSVINFTAAHTQSYRDAHGVEKSDTTWFNCSYFVERTNIASYLKKGTQILIDAVPSVKTYVNKSGITVPQFNLRVTSLQLLGSAKPTQDNNTPENIPPSSHDLLNSDDLPF